MSGDPMIKGGKCLILTSALFLMIINGVVSQGFFGVGMSYGLENTVSADLYYQHSLHQIHLGGSMQFPDTIPSTVRN